MTARADLHFRVLLAWAVEFVERETRQLEDSYRDPVTGNADDPDIEIDVADARRWLKEAREALK